MPTRRKLLASTAFATATSLAGCIGGSSSTPAPTTTSETGTETGTGTGTKTPSFGAPTLSSPAFEDGEPIPVTYTCSGEGRSPPLTVETVPSGTETLALVMDDPDAGSRPYVHWLVWNVPADRTKWPAGVPEGETAEGLDGATQGTNSRGVVGYVGPCPPPDDGAHTYRFALYALASSLDLDPGAKRSAVESAIAGTQHGVTTFRGTYER